MPSVFAIFDLDETLLEGNAGVIFIRHLYFKGIIKGAYRKIIPMEVYRYITGSISEDRMVELGSKALMGIHQDVLYREARCCLEEKLKDKFNEHILSILEIHKNLGHTTILASGSPVYIVRAVGDFLGFDHVLGSRVRVEDGVCTDVIEEPLCYKEGKLMRVERLLEKLGGTRWQCVFYSDSSDDLALLGWVMNPCAVRPEKDMERISKDRGFFVIH